MNWIPQGITPEVAFTTNDATGVEAAEAGRTTSAKKKINKHNKEEKNLMLSHPGTVVMRYIPQKCR
jgi:hypothetical protein